ncbi:MAG TPA: glycosyltransferase [Polyangiaceae bacterium]|nr:glycosyltransferase [Polyangiaceae bacterium]
MPDTETETPPLRLVVLMPVFDDFAAASLVCQALDHELSRVERLETTVLLLDDGSPAGLEGWTAFTPARLARIDVLRLRRNLGHQRAIAVGLCHVAAAAACDAVLVMDADGEDRPADVPRLIAELRGTPNAMIFAERRKRLEGVVFRLGYFAYRTLHRGLTGIAVRVGNFSLIPARALPRLTCMAELWNHYAGAALRSRWPQRRVPLDRGSRVHGRSRMGGLIPLVTHGIAGIATFHDVVATRILVASMGLMAFLGAAMLAVLAVRFGTSLAIPGWATYTLGLLLILSIQVTTFAFGLVLSLISTRPAATVVPCRDYGVFMGDIDSLWRRP